MVSDSSDVKLFLEFGASGVLPAMNRAEACRTSSSTSLGVNHSGYMLLQYTLNYIYT